MNLRIVVACALLGALAAGGLAAASERPYRARAFVIRLPPAYGTAEGLDWARSDPVLLRALEVAGRERQSPAWLRERSKVELTSRLDFAITVETPDREATAAARDRIRQGDPALIALRSGARHARSRRAARPARPRAGGLGPAGWRRRPLARRRARDRAQPRITPRTSSRFCSMCSRDTTDSRLRRSSGSVLEGRTLKCQSS